MAKIVTVDIDKIEQKIREKTEAIDTLTREKEFLEGLLQYAVQPLNGKSHRGAKAKPVKASRRSKKAKPVKPVKRKYRKKRISDFIIGVVGKGEIGIKEVVQSYADYMGKPTNLVYNSVNNALGRLTQADKLILKSDEFGNRTWAIK